MRVRIALFLIVLLLLTGCARPAPTSPPETPAATAPSPEKVNTAEPRPPAPADAVENELPVPAPPPEGLRRIDLAAGQPADHPGLYFMNAATGKVEGWLSPLKADGDPALVLSASQNERWIKVMGDQATYLVRRSDGQALRYDHRRLAVATGPGVMLAWPPYGSKEQRCTLLDEQGKVLSRFTLPTPTGCSQHPYAQFSPDGKTLAIASGSGNPPVFLVTVATGAVKPLAPFPLPSDVTLTDVALSTLPRSGELVVALRAHTATQVSSTVRRYSWQGDLRGESQFPGYATAFSPDGKLVAYSQHLGHRLGQSAVVQKWGADKPLFRVAGGNSPAWLADSEQFLVYSTLGYQLVSATGSMKPAPPTAAPPSPRSKMWLRPSPDNPDLIVTGPAIIDHTGRTRQELRLGGSKPLFVAHSDWGPASGEVSLTVLRSVGAGWEPVNDWITPKIQRPPFPDKYPLAVADPKGECLNLRSTPAQTSKVIRCLPNGTRLAVASQELPPESSLIWVPVVTDKGERGWVAFGTNSVSHVD